MVGGNGTGAGALSAAQRTASNGQRASVYDDSINVSKSSTNAGSSNSAAIPPVISTSSTPKPDRYHRRKSNYGASTGSNASTASSNTSTTSTTTIPTPCSSVGPGDQGFSVSSPMISPAVGLTDLDHLGVVYRSPVHSESASAVSSANSSRSKADYSSLGSATTVHSDASKGYRSFSPSSKSTAANIAAQQQHTPTQVQAQTQRKQRQSPPPLKLVLPSDARRSSNMRRGSNSGSRSGMGSSNNSSSSTLQSIPQSTQSASRGQHQQQRSKQGHSRGSSSISISAGAPAPPVVSMPMIRSVNNNTAVNTSTANAQRQRSPSPGSFPPVAVSASPSPSSSSMHLPSSNSSNRQPSLGAPASARSGPRQYSQSNMNRSKSYGAEPVPPMNSAQQSSVAASGTQPVSGGRSFGSRLKKAFMGKKLRSSPSIDAGASSGRSIRSVTMDRSDTQSLFSIRSTISTASFATFRKFGKSTKSLFKLKRNGSDEDEEDNNTYTSPPPTSASAAANASRKANGGSRQRPQLDNIEDEHNSPRFMYGERQARQQSESSVGDGSDLYDENDGIDDDDEAANTAVESDHHYDDNIKVDFREVTSSASRSTTVTASPSPVKTANVIPQPAAAATDTADCTSEATVTLESEGKGNETNQVPTPTISVTPPHQSDEDLTRKTGESAAAPSNEHGRFDSIDSDDLGPAGDTVFPKTLDVETVETIRFSLERAKSLERRKSAKRSIRRESTGPGTGFGGTGNGGFSKSEEEEEETGVPNATEIHVTQQPDTASIISASDGPVRGILKHGADSSRPSSMASSINASPKPIGDWNMSSTISSSNNRDSNADDVASVVASLLQFASEPQLSLDFDFDKKYKSDGTNSKASKPQQSSDQHKGSVENVEAAADVASSIPRPSSASQVPLSSQNQGQQTQRPSSPVRLTSAPSWSSMDGFTANNAETSSSNLTSASSTRSQSPISASVYQRRMSLHNRSSSFGSNASYNMPHQQYSMAGGASQYGRPRQLSQPINAIRFSSDSSTVQPKKAGVSFSSRIVVYDTYGRGDYDRRPEIATCNRLTPLLAQQIREELNKFKREMEIHVDSRGFTHFL